MLELWHAAPLKRDHICTFLCSLVVTVLEGARPPGAPRRHLTVDGTRDLAKLGPVGDRTLAQLVLHRTGGCRCADEHMVRLYVFLAAVNRNTTRLIYFHS